MRREVRGHVDAIQLVIVGFGQMSIVAIFNYNVTGGASAVSTAGVFQMDSKVEGNVEQRFGFSVPFVWQFSGLEFHGSADRQERYFRHLTSIASFDWPRRVP